MGKEEKLYFSWGVAVDAGQTYRRALPESGGADSCGNFSYTNIVL